MGKKSKSKAGGDFWDEDPELSPEFVGASSDVELDAELDDAEPGTMASTAPHEANMEDEWDNGLLGALRRNRKKKDRRAEEAEAEAAKNAEASTVLVKSKKEKEKEKKEREKAKKKAAAARKAASAPQPQKTKPVKSEDSGDEAEAASEVASAASTKGVKGKKKLNPALAAIQKQQAAKAAAEAAASAKEEAARRAAEDEERRLIEEEEAADEARRLKREKRKAKDEELKRQGKFLTKKQKEQQAQLARRREQLLASGVTVAGLLKGDAERSQGREAPKASTTATKPKAEVEAKLASIEVAKEEEASKTEAKLEVAEEPKEVVPDNSEDDALLSDWEAGLDDSENENDAQSAAEAASASASCSSANTTRNVASKKEAEDSAETGLDLNSLQRLDSKRRAEVDRRREQRTAQAISKADQSNLRSPICAILGHVDTGKTKLLDNMRKTNVQEGEAGGITQQIGATYFPIDMIKKKTESMKRHVALEFNVPGLLIIDTPGHESFTNLRSRGSSLCNMAILVIDIMHGLEPQTLESIRLLRDRKTPFIVALNKCDRIYGWESKPNMNSRDTLASQAENVQRQFEERLKTTKLLLAEQGFNSEIYYKNKNMAKYVSIVPTSAVSGEGVPDLLYLLLDLTTSRMSKQLMYLSELQATILEVKVVEGLGTTIDVVLSNGILREGDRIVLCGSNGPIATNVRALLTPQPAKELRIKSQYVHHKEVKAALGVKISANDLDHAIAGSRLLLVGPDDDEDELMDDVMDDMSGLLDTVDKSGEGVCVQASTLGSLEALLDFLKSSNIPVMSIGLGPVYKRDVMRATTMLDRKPELALMLCFDVRVDKDAEQYANERGIKIFTADIIYHLFDDFQKYQEDILEQRRREKVRDAVFPAVLNIVQVINKRNPMIIGVEIVEGSLRTGTPLAIVKADPVTGMKLTYPLGRIQSMEVEHKPRDEVRKGQAKGGIAVRLDSGNMTNMPTWGRHISESDKMYSLISRKSIDTLKDPAFRNDVPREDWLLIKKLKPIFDVN